MKSSVNCIIYKIRFGRYVKDGRNRSQYELLQTIDSAIEIAFKELNEFRKLQEVEYNRTNRVKCEVVDFEYKSL